MKQYSSHSLRHTALLLPQDWCSINISLWPDRCSDNLLQFRENWRAEQDSSNAHETRYDFEFARQFVASGKYFRRVSTQLPNEHSKVCIQVDGIVVDDWSRVKDRTLKRFSRRLGLQVSIYFQGCLYHLEYALLHDRSLHSLLLPLDDRWAHFEPGLWRQMAWEIAANIN